MPSIPLKPLGTNGPLVPKLGFGLMGLSAFAGETLPDSERLKLLDRAHELGEIFWDTSDVYGDSEDLLRKWFTRTGKRDDVFLATKFAGEILGDVGKGEFKFRSDGEWVRIACEKSLERIGVGSIDLYYAHRVQYETPIEETVGAMAELKKEGKIKCIGLCEVSSKTLRRAHAVHPITAVQIEYSPFTLDIERPEIGLLETCRELGVAVVAYSPLSRGLLTGSIKSKDDFEATDVRKLYPRFSDENFPKNLKLVETLKAMAEKKGCTVGQLTLAWLMAQDDLVFPIPGTRKVKYLEENIRSVDVHLTTEEVAAIRKAVDAAEVHGERYPDSMAIALFADTVEK